MVLSIVGIVPIAVPPVVVILKLSSRFITTVAENSVPVIAIGALAPRVNALGPVLLYWPSVSGIRVPSDRIS